MATVLLNDFPNTGRSTSFETTSFDYWATPPPPYSPPASRIRVDQHLDGPRAGDIHHSICRYTCQWCSKGSLFSFRFVVGPFLIVITIYLASNIFLMGVLIGRMIAEPNAYHALVDLDHTVQMWNRSQHQTLLLFKYEKETWANMRDKQQLQIMDILSQLQELQHELERDRMDWMKGLKQGEAEDRHNPVDIFMAAIELEGTETCPAYESKDYREKTKDEVCYLDVDDVTRP